MSKTAEEIISGYVSMNREHEYAENGIVSRADALAAMNAFADQRLEEYKQGQWISVKDQRPNNHSLVIIQMKSGAITLGRVMNTNKWGIFTNTGLDIETTMNYVTHWQPLPSPPTIL